MERLIRDHLMEHLKINNLLSNKQYGFISGRSVSLQLLTVMNDWTKIMDKGEAVDVIYLDFMKAFDKVPHRRLIHKLRGLGVHTQIIRWIENFLTERTQTVVYNGHSSAAKMVDSGIPQGTVIGPASFLTFIDDIADDIDSHIYLFADDTKVYRSVSHLEDCNRLQTDVDRLDAWSTKWLLHFNQVKCKVMTIGNSDTHYDYHMTKQDGTVIKVERSSLERDLGVLVDEHLSFSEHIHKISCTATGIMAVIRRTYTDLDADCFLLLYKALIRPHLEYCATIWSPYKMKDIETIEKVQKRATKQVKGLHSLSYEDRLRKLDILSLRFRRCRGDMIEVFKILHGIYDESITTELLTVMEGSITRGHHLKLCKQQCRLDVRKYNFLMRIVNPWNSLPDEVVSAPTIVSFEAKLDNVWQNQPMKYNYKEDLRL